jgi:NAD(P)-dependent dehydrogenase (short-subunit alcohol dehydrogenase family)
MAGISTGPMAGKTVLVTGGTGGIGKATAAGLAAMGSRVGITGRDTARTRAAAAEVATASGNPAVDPFPADMSSQAEVRRLAGEILAAYPRLDVLVNNVGGFWATRQITPDGLERTFAVNHLASFLLTGLLLDRLTAGAPARIVTVSSGAHATGKINFGDLQRRAPLLRAAGLQPVQTGQHPVHLRAGTPAGRHRRHRHRAAPGRGPHRIRRRGSLAVVEGLPSPDTALPQDARQGRGHLDLPRLFPRGRGRHRHILRRPQAEGLQPGLPRHRRRGQAVADQPRPRRTHRLTSRRPEVLTAATEHGW